MRNIGMQDKRQKAFRGGGMPVIKTFLTCWCFCLIAGLVISGAAQAQGGRSESIAAVVNDDAVSESDVIERLRLVIASSGIPDGREIRERMKPQILSVLIEEKLKLQEAARLEIEISDQEVAEGFAGIAGQNNMSAQEFTLLLGRQGVSRKSLEDQVRAQIAWAKVVQARLRPQVLIADSEVDAVLSRLSAGIGRNEYRVSEIFLPVDKPADEVDVRRLAERLNRQLADGKTPFGKLASQFSQAAGAARGGDMGWVQQGQLPEELEGALTQLREGEVSLPVRTPAGYHILMLRAQRSLTADNMPSRDQIMQNLGLERLDRLQRSYLLDLKTSAFIEQRV